MLKRLDLVLDSRKFVQEWPEKRQFLVKLRQIWNDFRHCAGSKSFFSSLLGLLCNGKAQPIVYPEEIDPTVTEIMKWAM